jgi:hypothetical protein
MGYMTELNTLLGLPKDFDESKLSVGSKHSVVKNRERAFPLHIAILLVTPEWEFLGYVVAHSMKNYADKCEIEFEVLSLFSNNEKKLYKEKFIEAARKTGEIK